jgi:hypothetical protein
VFCVGPQHDDELGWNLQGVTGPRLEAFGARLRAPQAVDPSMTDGSQDKLALLGVVTSWGLPPAAVNDLISLVDKVGELMVFKETVDWPDRDPDRPSDADRREACSTFEPFELEGGNAVDGVWHVTCVEPHVAWSEGLYDEAQDASQPWLAEVVSGEDPFRSFWLGAGLRRRVGVPVGQHRRGRRSEVAGLVGENHYQIRRLLSPRSSADAHERATPLGVALFVW